MCSCPGGIRVKTRRTTRGKIEEAGVALYAGTWIKTSDLVVNVYRNFKTVNL